MYSTPIKEAGAVYKLIIRSVLSFSLIEIRSFKICSRRSSHKRIATIEKPGAIEDLIQIALNFEMIILAVSYILYMYIVKKISKL